jgi:hypothetical protein
VPQRDPGTFGAGTSPGEPAGKLFQVAKDGGAPAAPNNPAGRVLAFLRDVEAVKNRAPQNSAMAGLVELMGGAQEAPEVYGAMAQLRLQARAAEDQMKAFSGVPGYRSYEKFYGQVHDVTMRLQVAHQYPAQEIFVSMSDAGWSSLEFADDVLSSHRPEPTLSVAEEGDYLAKIRSLIDAIASDEVLSVHDRTRLVELLRKVEQALLAVKINGFLPVQEAAAATGAIVSMSPSMLDRIRSRPWLRDTLTTLTGIVVLLQGADSGIAIAEYVTAMLGQ